MKTLMAAGLAALIGVGSIAAIELSTSPASAAAVVVKVGPRHHHHGRWYWKGHWYGHRHYTCRVWWSHHRRHRVCHWRYW